MAIDPKLLVITPVSELTEVTGLQEGSLLFYDGNTKLKRISIDTFNNLSKTAKPLSPSDPTPTEEGLYAPTISGTYTNAGDLIAQQGYYTLFFFDGTTWSKSETFILEGEVTPERTVSGDTSNIFLFSSGNNATIGENNLSTGYDSQTNKIFGDNNVNYGHNSQQQNGKENTSVGNENQKNNEGDENTSVGFASQFNVKGNRNTSVGKTSLFQVEGMNNTAIGNDAGVLLTKGDNMTFIGEGTKSPAECYNSIAIGKNATITKNNQVVLATSDTVEMLTFGEIRNGEKRMYYDAGQHHIFGGGAGPLTYSLSPGVYGNTAWGSNALSSILPGTSLMNTAFGHNALASCTTGIDHTAFGAGALQSIESGVGCSAFGRLSLPNCKGTNNSGFGDGTLENLVNGGSNTAIGYGAGIGIIDGDRNTLSGTYAGGWYGGASDGTQRFLNDTTVTGANALQSALNANRNSIFGSYAAHLLLDSDNAAFGYFALRSATTSSKNTSLGNFSGEKLLTGDENIFIGYRSGAETGQKNDVIGSIVIGVGSISTRDNEIVIGKNTDTHVTLAGVEFTRAQIIALKALV